jgi:tRNA threonylcarbamoyladenosine modification (KEOPS) complex Cgi121 subunit
LAVEILLFASGQRQIRRAIEMLGISPETSAIAALAISSERRKLLEAIEELPNVIGGERDDSVLEVKGDKLSFLKRLFNVSDKELEVMGGDAEALSKLIMERVALLMIKTKS